MAKMRFTRDEVEDTMHRKHIQNKEVRQHGWEDKSVGNIESWKNDPTEGVVGWVCYRREMVHARSASAKKKFTPSVLERSDEQAVK